MRRARRRNDDRGASLVELALIAPVMALIVMGVLDLSRAYRMQIRLENAAREGAAYAEKDPNRVGCAGTDDIPGRVISEDPSIASLPSFGVTVWTDTEGYRDFAVKITGCGGSLGDPDDRIRVDVKAKFDVITPMVERIVGNTIDVTGSAIVEAQG